MEIQLTSQPTPEVTEAQRRAATNVLANKHLDKATAEQEEVTRNASSTKQATVALLGNALSGGTTGDTNPLLQQVLLKLLDNLNRESEEKEAKNLEARDQQNRLRAAQVSNIKQEKARRENTQRACSHLKENGKTRIGGQKLSNGHVALFCSFCYKEFDETTIPPHLLPNGEHIGG